MRNLKKFLALVLAMMMTLSLLVVANAAPAKPTAFTDLDKVSPAYAEAVNVLSALKIIKGDDGFRPGDTITRAEVSAMLYRIAHNDASESQVKIYKDYDVFPDVKSDKWYAGSVNYCANSGYLKGYPNGTFGPSNDVTGYEVLVMTLRMLGYGKNGEFEGKQGDWRLQAAMYGRKAGLTKNIKEGTLGQPATREMVAEVMFQALQADLVDYNLLQNYYPAIVLIEDNADNRAAYANVIKAGALTLPLNSNLMYENYTIVGKSPALASDAFGRPSEAWMKDSKNDVMAGNGTAGKYVPNGFYTFTGTDYTDNAYYTGLVADLSGKAAEETALLVPVTPVATYTDAIDECHLTKEINDDTSIAWSAITEIVNGETLDHRAGTLDALHTSVNFVNATGRTLEVYEPTPGTWIFVYIDTFLGEVTGVTEEVKDTAGHTIIAAEATVELGNKIADGTGTATGTTNPAKLTLANPGGKYKVGDLVLVQTSNGGESAFVNTDLTSAGGGNKTPDPVDNPEKAPLYPVDVPNTVAKFMTNVDTIHGSILLSTGAKTLKNVTIKGTVGARDQKMGIITSDGTTYMASNTFLAARQAPASGGTKVNNTVLDYWYDVPNGTGTNDSDTPATLNRGIVNAMIGRTYDIVLDQNDHIIGLHEVLSINDGVGVITGIDSARVGSGKYVSEVEAFMTDGTTKTFQLLGKADGTGLIGGTALENMADGDYGYFKSMTDVDDAWGTGGMYEKPDATATGTVLSIGSLVQFKSLSYDGKTFYKIVDWDQTANSNQVAMVNGTAATGSAEAGNAAEDLDVAKGEVGSSLGQVKTGVTGTLQAGELNNSKLDDNSVIFVAEYEYRYNTSGNNDGSNINKTYQVYNGFKKMPTITGLDNGASNILYQQLGEQAGNSKYVLIYAKDITKEYTIKAQEKIAVDDSYLVLSRGATYAAYSEYNVLKNGVQTTLQVSNANTLVNDAIEATMKGGANENELLLVTGRNAAGYVTSVSTVKTQADASDTNALLNTGKLAGREIIAGAAAPGDISYAGGVLKTIATNNQYLTLDDNVKVQLVNRDQKTVTEISLDVAMVYANNTGNKLNSAKPMVFELNELGYVCNLYVIE